MKRRRVRRARKNGSTAGIIVGALAGGVITWFIDRNVLGIGGTPTIAVGGGAGAVAGWLLS